MADGTAHGVWLRARPSALNQRLLQTLGPTVARISRGQLPWLTYRTGPAPQPPSPAWLQLRPILAGICGSDLSVLTGKQSPILSPFASLPAVLGHEVVAKVSHGPRAGERVVVDPLISCEMRGLPWCGPCTDGLPGLCRNAAEGALAPGMMMGFCADLPGGWSDAMLAHHSQLHPVPEVLSDEEAVLVEPLSVAMHAVLHRVPEPGERVLVIGGGTLGLLTLAALRLTNPHLEVSVVVRHAAQERLATELGATTVLRGRGDDLLQRAARVAGASIYRSLDGVPVLRGGFNHVVDAVGTSDSLRTSLRLADARGRVVVLGGIGRVPDLDWTLVWARELELIGTYVYGREPGLTGAPHTFDHVMRLLVEHRDLELGRLVTHRFALSDWAGAMGAALDRGGRDAIKIAFEIPPPAAH